MQAQPRELLRSIPGLELAEPAEQAICCGSAGIYNLVQPQAARELGERKARNVAATGAQVYASANPGCLVQVSTALRRAGHAAPGAPPGRARWTRRSAASRRSDCSEWPAADYRTRTAAEESGKELRQRSATTAE